MGNVIAKSYELMSAVKPDALIVLGDTNSCLCVISAKRLKIPVFHMEAGNRCKDENLPEEVIRRIVDVTSDVNLCYSEHARRYILDSSVKPEYTFVVGSPMAEILNTYSESINSSDVLNKLGLEKNKYILLSAHREENIDNEDNFMSLMNAVNQMAEKYNMPILYSCHPRSKKYIEQRGFVFDQRIIQHIPLGFLITISFSNALFVLFRTVERFQRRGHILNFLLFLFGLLQNVQKLWRRASLCSVLFRQKGYYRPWILRPICIRIRIFH